MARKRVPTDLKAELARLYAESPLAIARAAANPKVYPAGAEITAETLDGLLADDDEVAAIFRQIGEIEA